MNLINIIALAVGWIVIVGTLVTVVLFGLEYQASDGIYRVSLYGYGGGVIDRNRRDNHRLYRNMRRCGYRLFKVGRFAVGFGYPVRR